MDDAPLRLGVLDIGSNSAHLRIADLDPGYPELFPERRPATLRGASLRAVT